MSIYERIHTCIRTHTYTDQGAKAQGIAMSIRTHTYTDQGAKAQGIAMSIYVYIAHIYAHIHTQIKEPKHRA